MTRWLAVLALLLTACPSRLAPRIEDYVPAGALVIAGARLDALRASPLYARLPKSFVEPFGDASTVWVVFSGTGLLTIAQGHFREAPPGATLVGSTLMLSGSQELVQAALAQRRAGAPGSPDLLAQASAAAEGHAVWIATRGRILLPLSGDLANINRFLRLADFATVGLRIEAPMRLDLAAQCPTPETAQNLEESLRAFLSLSVLGVARQPQLAAMLRAAEVVRDGRAVHASLTAPPDVLPQLFDYFGR